MPLVVKNGDLVTVSGSLATDVACCCDGPDECPCLFPTEWRITDADGNVYAKGPVVAVGGPQCETVVPSLEDLPNPFTPLFYWATGEIEFTLELLGCNEEAWDTLDSWSATISLCDDGRYPSQSLDGPWQPPGPCQCKNQQNVDDGIEECDPCPDLTAGSGDGQEWRDPQPGTATTFTGAIDGEWTNLLNWEDANGLTPAGSLPGIGTNVSVEANVTSTAGAISVGELTIQAGAEFSVAASAADLHCYGAIERNALCEGVFGVVTVMSGEAFVYGGGRNNGEIVNALVKFSGDGLNDTDGVVTGDARFDDTSRNDGTIAGDAGLHDGSYNNGTITGDAEFYDDSVNSAVAGEYTGTVGGNATFHDDSFNAGGVVEGNAEFHENSQNVQLGWVKGNAVFNDTTKNDGAVDGDAEFNDSSWNGYDTGRPSLPSGQESVGGTATFNGASKNTQNDVSVAVFNDSAENTSSIFGGGIFIGGVATATFNDDSVNDGGTADTATFNDSASNNGIVGSATFNDSASNDNTVGSATFNGTTSNAGIVSSSATFNGSSVNAASGIVSGGATFNDDTIHQGSAGTAIFNDCSYNEGGTASTFVPDPPPDEYPC